MYPSGLVQKTLFHISTVDASTFYPQIGSGDGCEDYTRDKE